jgi:hypothetical protein
MSAAAAGTASAKDVSFQLPPSVTSKRVPTALLIVKQSGRDLVAWRRCRDTLPRPLWRFSQHGTCKLVFKGIIQVQRVGFRDPIFGEGASHQRLPKAFDHGRVNTLTGV